jgi:hypothetical protein
MAYYRIRLKGGTSIERRGFTAVLGPGAVDHTLHESVFYFSNPASTEIILTNYMSIASSTIQVEVEEVTFGDFIERG